MSFLSENMRYLRAKRNLSQQKVADALIITRARYAKYEESTSEPPLDLLQKIARYFHVSIDLLVGVDLRRVPMEELVKLDGNRILLPIMVDRQGENFIEIIPHSAKAGYTTGYADPEFIEGLEHISLPFLNKGKYRAFPIEGDSMPPHREGDFVIGRFVEDKSEVKDGKTYIILTLNEGIVYKRVQVKDENNYILQSDNAFYETYDIRHENIIEIWEFAGSIATTEFQPGDFTQENIADMFRELKKDLREIKKHIK